ncbi:MAG: glycosyltransferase [bacterium]
MALFIFYQGLIAFALFLVLWNYRRNLRDFLYLRHFENGEPPLKPFVSVLIPARNEERNILRLIKSLLSQDYDHLEIIVLDDQSTDRTKEILERLKEQNAGKRIKILEGKALPKGWMGKNYACHQLAQEAQGEILLFLDADTWLAPRAIRSGLSALYETQSDFLSLLPTEVTGTLWEKMIIPFMHFAPMCLLPFRLIRTSPNPLISMAVGQFMMFRKSAYSKIGGHASVKGEVVEDIMLARRVKEFGLMPLFLDGNSLVFCRMYRNLKEVWLGFSKFLFAVFQFHLLPLLLVMGIFDALFLFPFFYLLRIFLGADYPLLGEILIFLQVMAIIWLRLRHSLRFQSKGDVLLHPFAMIHINFIALFSVFLHLSGIGVIWKGRKYRTVAGEEPTFDSEEEENTAPFNFHSKV